MKARRMGKGGPRQKGRWQYRRTNRVLFPRGMDGLNRRRAMMIFSYHGEEAKSLQMWQLRFYRCCMNLIHDGDKKSTIFVVDLLQKPTV